MLAKRLGELRFRHAVGGPGFLETRIASEVADGVDPGDTRHAIRMLNGPVVLHQGPAASGKKTCFLPESAVFFKFPVKCGIEGPAFRIPERFPHVQARNGEPGLRKSFKHPLFFDTRKTGQRGRIPDPGGFGSARSAFGRNQEGFVIFNREGFAVDREFLGHETTERLSNVRRKIVVRGQNKSRA